MFGVGKGPGRRVPLDGHPAKAADLLLVGLCHQTQTWFCSKASRLLQQLFRIRLSFIQMFLHWGARTFKRPVFQFTSCVPVIFKKSLCLNTAFFMKIGYVQADSPENIVAWELAIFCDLYFLGLCSLEVSAPVVLPPPVWSCFGLLTKCLLFEDSLGLVYFWIYGPPQRALLIDCSVRSYVMCAVVVVRRVVVHWWVGRHADVSCRDAAAVAVVSARLYHCGNKPGHRTLRERQGRGDHHGNQGKPVHHSQDVSTMSW